MSNQILNDFTQFLGMLNFDCSGDRLKHTADGNKLHFHDSSVNKAYQAYRFAMGNGYTFGLNFAKQQAVNLINDIGVKK